MPNPHPEQTAMPLLQVAHESASLSCIGKPKIAPKGGDGGKGVWTGLVVLSKKRSVPRRTGPVQVNGRAWANGCSEWARWAELRGFPRTGVSLPGN